MCELFGASLKRETNLKKYLEEFYRHSVEHPHGWGIMLTEKNQRTIIKKAPQTAYKSPELRKILDEIEPKKYMLAHIRFATVGATGSENCHPFTYDDALGNQWVMMHNGTVYSDKKIRKYAEFQKGSTDSERVFLYFLDRINQEIRLVHKALTDEQKFKIFEDTVLELSPRNKLNLMIFDGKILYVHKNMSKTLFYKKDDNGYLISTKPLDNFLWKPVPKCQAFAIKNGKKIFEGTPHKNEFKSSLENITPFDAMNI